MKTEQTGGRLPLRTMLGFGVADPGGNLFFAATGFWSLNYLTDTVALPAAAAGTAVMVGKLWDAVTDRAMGFISDRTRSRWGRRRPYLLFGAVPAQYRLHGGQQPHSSLTPELTRDYHERSSLNGFRFGFAVMDGTSRMDGTGVSSDEFIAYLAGRPARYPTTSQPSASASSTSGKYRPRPASLPGTPPKPPRAEPASTRLSPPPRPPAPESSGWSPRLASMV